MRSPSLLTLIVFMGISPLARGETTRVRVPLTALPRDNLFDIPGKDAVLPDGVREGSPVPRSWRVERVDEQEYGHCTDARRGSVAIVRNDNTYTQRVWQSSTDAFIDAAEVHVVDGKAHVIGASRKRIAAVTATVWAYKKGDTVAVITALDTGVNAKAVSFGCSLEEIIVNFPGASTFASRPDDAEAVRRAYGAYPGSRRERWAGQAFTALATVSKASSDPEPMFSFLLRAP